MVFHVQQFHMDGFYMIHAIGDCIQHAIFLSIFSIPFEVFCNWWKQRRFLFSFDALAMAWALSTLSQKSQECTFPHYHICNSPLVQNQAQFFSSLLYSVKILFVHIIIGSHVAIKMELKLSPRSQILGTSVCQSEAIVKRNMTMWPTLRAKS